MAAFEALDFPTFNERVAKYDLTKRALDVTPNILEIKMEVQDKWTFKIFAL